jgi:hypothetical protein
MVLDARDEAEDGTVRGRYLALNDVVLHRGGVARMIRMVVHAHQEEVGTYSADGIILATPTGSTAYSLSAGGPIVSPAVDCIVATPISPHTLAVRPLILSAAETVTVEVLSPSEELILTIDGQQGAILTPGDRLRVSRAPLPCYLVRFPGQTFFSTLRRKLRWGTWTSASVRSVHRIRSRERRRSPWGTAPLRCRRVVLRCRARPGRRCASYSRPVGEMVSGRSPKPIISASNGAGSAR